MQARCPTIHSVAISVPTLMLSVRSSLVVSGPIKQPLRYCLAVLQPKLLVCYRRAATL